jgi:hypothetical protein
MRDSSLSRALRTRRVLPPAPLSKIAPGDFVEPSGYVHPPLSRNANGPEWGRLHFLAERVGFEPTVR